jgi:hypothetical protein
MLRRVLILDSISALDISSRRNDEDVGAPLRALLTPDAAPLPLPVWAGGGSIPPLETGAVVPGPTAALLTRRLLSAAPAAAVLAVLPDEGAAAAAAARAVIADAIATARGDPAALLAPASGRGPAEPLSGNPLYL